MNINDFPTGGIFGGGGHAPKFQGATSRPSMKTRLEKFKEEKQEEVDEIATELIRGNFEVHSTEVSVGTFGLGETTKMNVIIGHRYEVEITIKG
ncbi:hypothetical protein CN613_25405 [Bacillus pseudomycoides]|uniref:Uncharacterized protein n=1 Tax=Bacillus pseudomycoides TaxID=64104 RepID=A0A2A8BZ94_9BACI|nr:hypothetical protein [Bacillus pseudomycoides]PEM65285.1 hypothetical protein CN613_25405 [Bacillus pseudomycoides]